MKNAQKGFAPILLILLAVAVIGGGVYVYDQKNDLGIFGEKEVLDVPTIIEEKKEDKNNYLEIDKEKVVNTNSFEEEMPEKKSENIVVNTQLKSGLQTKIQTATSTTIIFKSNDGLNSTTTISKEEEDYIKNNTVYKCGNEECFEKNFASCTPDNATINMGGFLGSVYYEIKGKAQQGCNLLFKYIEYPNQEWANKEMICSVDNNLGFESATMDMFQLVSSGELECTGPLYKILHPQNF